MKQLELDFNSDNLLDYYEAYQVIDEGKKNSKFPVEGLSELEFEKQFTGKNRRIKRFR